MINYFIYSNLSILFKVINLVFINNFEIYDFYRWICNFVNTSAYYCLL